MKSKGGGHGQFYARTLIQTVPPSDGFCNCDEWIMEARVPICRRAPLSLAPRVTELMQLDAARLRDFYRTPLGQVVRRQLVAQIRKRWTAVSGLTVMGTGFPTPYLGSYRSEAARTGCLMPARQGALIWPPGGKCHSVLVEEHHWPLPDNCVDRLLAVHMLEAAEHVGPVLREMWRVLAPDGRLILIVPNRTGVWSRIDTTPFGHGLPFSTSQLAQHLSDALLTPMGWGGALYFPPLTNRLALRMAPAIERTGTRLSRGLGGVIIVEARKDLMAPIGGVVRTQSVPVFKPAGSFTRHGATSVMEKSAPPAALEQKHGLLTE